MTSRTLLSACRSSHTSLLSARRTTSSTSSSTSLTYSFSTNAKDALAQLTKPKLHYFAFRGRALACRVALFNSLGKDGWTDNRVSLPRFKKDPNNLPKQNPDRLNDIENKYITNNLPQLDLPCGTRVSQSHAIARYAARLQPKSTHLPPHFLRNLYPDDKVSAMIVDEAVAIVDQILLLTPKDADPKTRTVRREEYQGTGFLRVGMEVLEGRLRNSDNNGPFLLGEQLTIADLYIRAPLCDLFELGQFEGVDVDFYDAFPRIKACGNAVLEHPLLKAYHQSYKN